MDVSEFRKMAMNFPEAEEKPHFEKTSFRIKGKIFATFNISTEIATLKFSMVDQSVFCDMGKLQIYPVPNKWGKQGWTHLEVNKLDNMIIQDALTASFKLVAPKKISDKL